MNAIAVNTEDVMPKVKTVNEHKKPRRKRDEPADTYNPVNMAGREIATPKDAHRDNEPAKDDYNPVNMAGRKADASKEDDVPKPGDAKAE